MKCSKCSTEYEGNFCPNCGNRENGGEQPKKKKKKPFYKRWWFIVLVLVVAIVTASKIKTSISERIDWSEIEMCEIIPAPNSKKGKIMTNSENDVSVYIYKVSRSDFKDYVSQCKDEGFTVDSDSSDGSYDAYNEDGYKLRLYYYNSEEKMQIDLDAPEKLSSISWPKSKLGKAVPQPESLEGKFSYENDEEFSVVIGNTDIDAYNEYVDACIEHGFDVDYSKDDERYSAKNMEGYSISVQYEGNNMMSINASVPDEEEEETTKKQPQSEKTTEAEKTKPSKESKESSGLRPEFKEAMDSYESFMNKYVDFMKKYKEANGADLSLISDYAKYMSEYSDMVDKFDEWEDEDMNNEELAYYIDVQARVSKKLLEVSE